MDALMSQWDDSALGRFGREVDILVQRIEMQAADLASQTPSTNNDPRYETIFQRRVDSLFDRLAQVAGHERALEVFEEVIGRSRKI